MSVEIWGLGGLGEIIMIELGLIQKVSGKFKGVLSMILLYLYLIGTVTFGCFILEEAGQVFIWSTWPAQDAKRWDLVRRSCCGIRATNTTMKVINYSLGWLNPVAFFAYRAFGRSMDAYIEALEAKCFANAPELFIGESMEFSFVPKYVKREGDLYKLKSGKMVIIADTNPGFKKVKILGIVERRNGQIVVRAIKIIEER